MKNEASLRGEFELALQKRVSNIVEGFWKEDFKTPSFLTFDKTSAHLEMLESLFDPKVRVLRDVQPLHYSQQVKWPTKIKKGHLQKLKQYIEMAMQNYVRDAERLVRIAPFSIELFPENTGWNHIPDNKHYYTPERYFLNATYRGGSSHMHIFPCLDYLLFEDAELFLKRINTLVHFELWLTEISNKDGYFDSIFSALLVNHSCFQLKWAESSGGSRGVPATISKFCEVMRAYINKTELTKALRNAGSGTSFAKGLHLAALGLYDEDPGKLMDGTELICSSWPKTNIAVWDGGRYPFVNVPAISMLRTGHRNGMSVDIPDALSMFSELVFCEDPNSFDLGYSLFPGIKNISKNETFSSKELLLG